MATDGLGWEDSVGDLISPGDVIADKYRVDRVLGTGGMGVVVEAWHLHFEERVAIKFLLPSVASNAEAVARFEREARSAFKIKSEHVARVIDVGKLPDSSPYLVMEFLHGRDLGDLLAEQRRLPVEIAVDYVLQACEAVAEAHAAGIVHRDLKPENLFLSRRADGTACIKVLDFGLSKVAVKDQEVKRQRSLTSTAQVMGTPQYMSPEQWMSARNVGPGTDLWALGVILFELVTGVQPFDREQLAQLCTLILTGQPPPMSSLMPGLPPSLEPIILRCLEKDPTKRFANVAEFAQALSVFAPQWGTTSAQRIAGVLRHRGGAGESSVPRAAPALATGSVGHVPSAGGTWPAPAPAQPVAWSSATPPFPGPAPATGVAGALPPLGAAPAAAHPGYATSGSSPYAGGHAPEGEAGAAGAALLESGQHPIPYAAPAPAGYGHPATSGGVAAGGFGVDGLAAGGFGTAAVGADGSGSYQGLPPVRSHKAETAQSWQHVVIDPPRRRSARAAAVLLGVLALAGGGLFLAVGGSETGTSTAAAPEPDVDTPPTDPPVASGGPAAPSSSDSAQPDPTSSAAALPASSSPPTSPSAPRIQGAPVRPTATPAPPPPPPAVSVNRPRHPPPDPGARF